MRQSAHEIEELDVQEGAAAIGKVRSREETPRMLIADDDPSILRLLADHCARMGFDVDTASNGIQALLKAGRFKPDTLERCEGFGAYYARKGPNFWNDLEAALAEIHPHMVGRIRQSSMHTPAPAVRKRPRVLLVDDDNDINLFLSSRLEKCGLDVQYAPDAQQGFRMACRDEPAVIVTDYFMPNGDAQYLLTRLRTTAATENIPVIVISGRRLSEVTEQCLRREICGHPGATEILRKSQDTDALFQALKKFCGFEGEHPGSANLA